MEDGHDVSLTRISPLKCPPPPTPSSLSPQPMSHRADGLYYSEDLHASGLDSSRDDLQR